MKITQNIPLSGRSSLFLLLLIYLIQASQATNSSTCSPSACGVLRDISFPFRLKHDPIHCGIPEYELSCENNVTLVYFNSQKYEVKAINYNNFTIKLVDVSINNTNACLFPNHSLSQDSFLVHPQNSLSQASLLIPHPRYPYSIFSTPYQDFPTVAWPINFMSCPYPLNNSSLLTDTCAANSSNGRHSYIKIGHMHPSDVNFMCRIDLIVFTSWKFKDLKNASASEIHDSLLYGFELSWLSYLCGNCRTTNCYLGENNTFMCEGSSAFSSALTIVMIAVVLVVVFVGVGIPAQIIFGIACFLGLSFLFRWKFAFRSVQPEQDSTTFAYFGVYVALSFAARFVIGFICLMGFLIYKFRRRHRSMFDVIESFLESDNKLMPIRYSYSDIKKMTRGFREKLGQGGYGTVYKGKLRSGTDVAVKLLGKAGADDKDFMNEIATIGRIHHINVVRLVGYCAERSKRALVYDFMPNGSLDKYIKIQENINSLDWQTKYEIAVGVARGIEYLHRGCDIQILHFDIKPHNILLDDKFIPKISDFGLAEFYSTEKKTVTLTGVRGTVGYVAPEIANRGFGKVSYKADVYSFGMLLIEMLGVKNDLRGNDERSTQYFPDWIYYDFDQGTNNEIDEIVEEDDNDDNRRILRKMTIVALWCILIIPDHRPSMNEVLKMLEGEVEDLQIPQRPTQPTHVVLDEGQSWTTYSTDSTSSTSRLQYKVYNSESV